TFPLISSVYMVFSFHWFRRNLIDQGGRTLILARLNVHLELFQNLTLLCLWALNESTRSPTTERKEVDDADFLTQTKDKSAAYVHQVYNAWPDTFRAARSSALDPSVTE